MRENLFRNLLLSMLLLQITIWILAGRHLFFKKNTTADSSLNLAKLELKKFEVQLAPQHEQSIIMVRHFLSATGGYISLTHNIYGYTFEHPFSERVTFPIYEIFKNLDNYQPWLRVFLLRPTAINTTIAMSWQDHITGFELSGQYFIGLDLLHFIVKTLQRTKVLALFRDEENDEYLRYAIYDDFVLGNATEEYRIQKLGMFRGNTENWFSSYLDKGYLAYNVSDLEEQQRYEDRCPMLALYGWWGGANRFCKLPLSFRGSLELYIRPFNKDFYLMEI